MEAVADVFLESSLFSDQGAFQLYAVVILGLAAVCVQEWMRKEA